MFETARLTLRAFRKDDVTPLVKAFNTYAVQVRSSPNFVVPQPEPQSEAAQLEFVKECTLCAIVEDRDVEVGLSIELGSWGKGYGTEVMKWLVDYGFRGLGMHRLSLVTYATNEAALALYKKTGLVYEGAKKKAAWVDGQWVDLVAMGIVDEDFWAAQKTAAGCPAARPEPKSARAVFMDRRVVQRYKDAQRPCSAPTAAQHTTMFETAHLLLRGYRKSDADALHDSWNTYAVQVLATTGYVVPHPESYKASTEWWLAQALLFVVVEDKESGKYVGRASLRGATPRDRDAEVAISLSPEWWGKGYGTEIMTWLVDYGFRGLGLHRLSLSATSNNNRALALYKKVGFVEEIVRKKAAWSEGRWEDVIEMGIVEDDFARHAQTETLESKKV
ncbi:hypothetical protein EVG20_g191 [Dentipellis fragilis]|uniref:N-acetyltransferase domain-containing protein n=1 Tax=Dentipellis fragilis TaxID=205917 RepID=A0A4Y9ZH69_9AGAM|nr:hypothetical protein EVG20_g191 [Dentipellis fragilis]